MKKKQIWMVDEERMELFITIIFYKKFLPIQLTFSKIILEKLHNCRDVLLFLAKSEYLNPYIAPFWIFI